MLGKLIVWVIAKKKRGRPKVGPEINLIESRPPIRRSRQNDRKSRSGKRR
jgi:hypothetical protein